LDAYIYDHVRTPRGKGRSDGGLHEITPIQLATQALRAIRDRNQLDTALIEDVILGCVSPIGEQGDGPERRTIAVCPGPSTPKKRSRGPAQLASIVTAPACSTENGSSNVASRPSGTAIV
jgi:acetyl-CoA acetyltransferase